MARNGAKIAVPVSPPAEAPAAIGGSVGVRSPGSELQSLVRRLESEIETLHRLAMVGMMASMAAHEWNNLVTPVLARAEDALSRNDVESMRHALERTIANIKKSVTVSKSMLSFAKSAGEELEAVAVAGAVREALETGIRPLDKDRIELKLDIGDDCLIRAHRVLFEQLLLNLVLNARQAMNERGGFLTISARREAEMVRIDVRDTGVGIPRETIDQIINPLLRGTEDATRAWQALGTGLNVCRTIAHQHAATIDVRPNEEGRGCTFRLYWPAA